jgi:hypothetical protein
MNLEVKKKLLNLALILSSFLGYLEWGGNNSDFLIQAEIGIIQRLIQNPESVAHPFTLLPLFGQLLLFITLFQRKVSRRLSYLGMGGIGILLVFMFVIGLLSLKLKITLSTLPFLLSGAFTIAFYRKNRNNYI